MPFEYPRAGRSGVPGNDQAAYEVERLLEFLAAAGVQPGKLGPSLVSGYASFYRKLPSSLQIDKAQVPLLYQLLGSGTGPLKMSKKDSAYQDRPVGGQRCGNCSSAYQSLAEGDVICSQVEGKVERQAWCRLWNTDRG